jgi:hypothetical protein
MTYNYRLRSAVAAIFATGLTFLFAVVTTTGQALPAATLFGVA